VRKKGCSYRDLTVQSCCPLRLVAISGGR